MKLGPFNIVIIILTALIAILACVVAIYVKPIDKDAYIARLTEKQVVSHQDIPEPVLNEPLPPPPQNISNKIVALCFDDGPHKGTEKLLDILDEFHIKATFFVIGQNIARFKSSFDRIVADGHEIANHTYDHPDITTISLEDALSNIEQCKEEIEKYYTGPIRFFRPPHWNTTRAYNKAIKERFGYTITMGFGCNDYGVSTTVDDVYNNAVELEVNEKMVLVLHCDEDNPGNKMYLRKILTKYIQDGYSFVTMSEYYSFN